MRTKDVLLTGRTTYFSLLVLYDLIHYIISRVFVILIYLLMYVYDARFKNMYNL
jgi:hypothetical protein